MMTKKTKKAEAKSRANHPTAKGGGKPSTEPLLITNKAQEFFHMGDEVKAGKPIEQIWAEHLTDVALIDVFRRFTEEPKGWKKAQREALFAEAYKRFLVLFQVKEQVQNHIDAYANALRAREHGGWAQDRAIKDICATLEHYNHPHQPWDSAQ